jgi:hypothetical protein
MLLAWAGTPGFCPNTSRVATVPFTLTGKGPHIPKSSEVMLRSLGANTDNTSGGATPTQPGRGSSKTGNRVFNIDKGVREFVQICKLPDRHGQRLPRP